MPPLARRPALALALSLGGASAFRTSVVDDGARRWWGGAKNASCEEQAVCLVSANAITAHKEGVPGLMEACLRANSKTQVVALALQDYPGGDFPHYVKQLEGMERGQRFKLRHQVMLTDVAGKGHFCHSHFAGGALAGAAAGGFLGFKIGLLAHLGGPVVGFTVKSLTTVVGAVGGAIAAHAASSALGASCGGVAVVVYSLRKVEVEFDSEDPEALRTMGTGLTATTRKGTVAVRIGMNGRSLVLASTHGTEGVRGKERSAHCPAHDGDDEADSGLKEESRRVEDFRTALGLIGELRGGGAGVLWGGDFNPRTVEPSGPRAGCPMWPRGAAHDEDDLARLESGRDILGSEGGGLVTFTSMLEGSGLSEARDLKCPTYKKQKEKPSTDPEKAQFRCVEDGHTMHYKASHPPSWTDRVFHNAAVTPWLQCGKLHRNVHTADHDAVLVTCGVQPGESRGGRKANAEEEEEEEYARCCCKGAEGECRLMGEDELSDNWKPWKWGEKVCPGGWDNWHWWKKYHDQMPEACLDALEGVIDEQPASS